MVTETKVTEKNQLDYIMQYESGELSDEETIKLFQYLIDTGLAWKLQEHYGRTATELIKAGVCEQE
jgi:hypothetical protein